MTVTRAIVFGLLVTLSAPGAGAADERSPRKLGLALREAIFDGD